MQVRRALLSVLPAAALAAGCSGGGGGSSPAPPPPAPSLTVSSVTPNSGTPSGGTTITIAGGDFVSGATVAIGGAAATSVAFVDVNTLTAATPSGAVGPADVTVTNPGGLAGTLVSGFTYVGPAPTVSGFTPTAGPNTGGTNLTISGSNFFAGATVTVGGAAASVTSVTSGQIVAVTPSLAPSIGPHSVTVTNLDGNTVTAGGAFNALGQNPTVTAVNPGLGPNSGGTTITLSGANYYAGAAVTVGGVACGSVTVASASQITCVTPSVAPTIGPLNVSVTNIDGLVGTLNGGFTAQGAAPTLTSITPTQGTNSGGTIVTLAGGNFAGGATVMLGGVAATVSSVTAPQIVAVTPNVAPTQGAVNVVVTNVDGQSVTLANGFTWLGAAPTLASVSPTSGPNSGGNTITLTGTGLAAGATVTVAGSTAGSVTVGGGGTQITCTVPSLTTMAGPVTIVVTNPDTQQAALSGQYTLLGATPTFTSITPAQGPNTGGTVVTIAGSNLLLGATVTIGGQAATSVTVTPSAQIVCTTPSVSPNLGPQDVVVTNGDGKSVTALGAWNAREGAPSVGSIAPTSGPSTGGTWVTLTGTNFFAGATVTVGGVLCGSIDVVNSTTIRAVTLNDGSLTGAQNVVVTNLDGQSATLNNGYTLNGSTAPTITVISPRGGPQAGGTTVAINGTNFLAGATVQIGSAAATVQSVTRDTLVVTTGSVGGSPPIAASVVVTNPGGASATLTNGYTFLGPAPVISSFSPTSGPQGGGNTVTITGSGFVSGAQVWVEGTFWAGTSESVGGGGTTLTVVMPNVGQSTGPLRVTVENPDSQTDTNQGGYLFEGPLPTVTNVSASTGSVGGGTFVTVTGSNFIPGATVEFGGVKATKVTVNGFPATTLTCYTPAGAATGAVTVRVTNDDLRSGQQSNAFTYVTGPGITGVSPSSGPVSGGTLVTLAGTGFATGDTVRFGANAATSVTVVSAIQITCLTPASTFFGLVDVTVTPATGPLTRKTGAYLFRNGVDAQTAVFTWDTSTGIDCTRRWYVNLNEAATLKDLQNRGLQSWGTPADSTRPPANLPLVDQYALDWMRAYVLRTSSLIYGRNPDGTKVSGQSINITFTGLPPTAGTPAPFACGPNDYSVISCGGCNGSAGFVASQTGSGCNGGVIGTAPYDDPSGANPCNANAEHVSNSVYHNCTGCGTGLGIFAANIGNAWGQSLSPRLSAADQQYLDGTVNAGARFNQIHDFMKQFARRIAFVACHEMGHSLGLAGDGTVGPCPQSSGQCGATPAHTSCCSTNLMAPTLSLGATASDYSRGFGGNPDPGNPSKASSCGNPVTSWQVLQSYLGVAP